MDEPTDKLLEKRMLSVPQIAELCGLHRSTVNRHDKEGKIAVYAKRVPGYKWGMYCVSRGTAEIHRYRKDARDGAESKSKAAN
jgi:hypothetical protein